MIFEAASFHFDMVSQNSWHLGMGGCLHAFVERSMTMGQLLEIQTVAQSNS